MSAMPPNPFATPSPPQWASRGLLVSLVLLPFGFFAGGVVVHGGDPGLPIVLVPIGALALVVALGSIVLTLLRRR